MNIRGYFDGGNMIELNKVYNQDCLIGMKDILDKSIDSIITDPPYGINFRSNRDSKKRFDFIANDDNLDFFEPFIKEAYRILNDDRCIFIFCRFDNYPYFYEVVRKAGFEVKNCLICEKNKALGGLGDMEGSFLNNYEFILFATKGKKILFKDRIGRQFGLISDKSISSPMQLIYPTQKPVSLIRKLICIATNEREIVLDPFIGSGTTALACKQTNRQFIGFDVSEKAVSLAINRLKQQILTNSEPNTIQFTNENKENIRLIQRTRT